jgi:predicted nucleic acid-binding protein
MMEKCELGRGEGLYLLIRGDKLIIINLATEKTFMKKIYLDVCCLNRPFDDQTQGRIKLETEAIFLILKRFETGQWQWVSSEVVDFEIAQTPNLERRNQVYSLLIAVQTFVLLNKELIKRGEELQTKGFDGYDALHLACAEHEQAEVFLTTDDKLQRLASRYATQLTVHVDNPLRWFQEVINYE